MVLELNPGITFHDGTPCDAEAVRWNLDRFMNGARSSAKPDLASVASIEVGGPLKVVLHLKNPDTALPVILSERCGMMSSPKAVKEAGDDYDRRPCGTGPFKFVSWADADRIIVTRNENYWKKDGPLLDGITFRIITDYAAGARSVVAGENDFMYLVPPRLFKNLSADKNLTVIKAPSMRTMNLFFNYGRGPLQDVRVRQAINYAIDRKGFARVTTDGTGAASGSLIVPQHWAADAASMDRYPLDLEKAKRLLAEAGLEKGFELSMVVLPDAEYRKRAEIVTDNLKKIGITVNMMPVQQANATFLADKKGDMYLVAWPGKPDMTQTYNLVFSKSSFYNPAGITPVENIEQLVDATRMSEDVGERKAAFAKLINAEREAALFAPICSEQLVYAMRTKVKGFEPNLLGKPKFDGVYLDT